MKEGKITKVVAEKGFFFVDEEYWCHINQYSDRTPEKGDLVEYEPEIVPNGKKNAKHCRLIMKASNETEPNDKSDKSVSGTPLDEYFASLREGYFNNDGYLKEEFIIKYPKLLAKRFSGRNKSAQLDKFYYNFKFIETLYKIRKDFGDTKVELLKLVPLTEVSLKREHISNEFKRFLEENILKATESEKSFSEGFISHMQSFKGYF